MSEPEKKEPCNCGKNKPSVKNNNRPKVSKSVKVGDAETVKALSGEPGTCGFCQWYWQNNEWHQGALGTNCVAFSGCGCAYPNFRGYDGIETEPGYGYVDVYCQTNPPTSADYNASCPGQCTWEAYEEPDYTMVWRLASSTCTDLANYTCACDYPNMVPPAAAGAGFTITTYCTGHSDNNTNTPCSNLCTWRLDGSSTNAFVWHKIDGCTSQTTCSTCDAPNFFPSAVPTSTLYVTTPCYTQTTQTNWTNNCAGGCLWQMNNLGVWHLATPQQNPTCPEFDSSSPGTCSCPQPTGTFPQPYSQYAGLTYRTRCNSISTNTGGT